MTRARLVVITRVLRALIIAALFSGVLAVGFLCLLGVLGFVAGYFGIMTVLAISACVWLGGTAYLAPRLYRGFQSANADEKVVE